MMWRKKAVALVNLAAILTFAGCENDSAEKIAKLQEHVARVTQQLNDTKKQVDGLQEANQRTVQALENMEATIARLSAPPGASPSGKSPAKGFAEQDLPSSAQLGRTHPESAPAPASVLPSFADEPDSTSGSQQRTTPSSAVLCTKAWKQLGQGKSAEVVARALGVSVDVIHACEQKIGRHGVGR